MATPIGHSIVGLAAGRFGGAILPRHPWRWYLFVVIAANAADLDFIPGLLVGDINRYHQLMSHSLLAAVIFGVLAGVAMRHAPAPLRFGVLAGGLYATHLVLDWLTFDGRSPFGLPLLWPFSQEHFIAPVTPFGGVRHGVPGEGFAAVVGQLFSWRNLGVLAFEAVVLTPLLGVAWYVRRGRACRLRES